MDGRTNGRMNEWTDGRVTFLCYLIFSRSDLFGEAPPLSYFFSEQPLIWVTSALSCLTANSFCNSCTFFFAQLLKWVQQPPAASRMAQE